MRNRPTGSTTPLTAGDQKTTFQAIVSDTLGEDSDYEVVRNIHDNLNEMIEQSKEEPEPLELSKTDVRKLLTRSGVAEEKLESFDDEFDETVGIHGTLLASNIASAKTITLKNAQGNTSVIKSADLDVLGGSFRPITESQKNVNNSDFIPSNTS